MDNLDKLVSEFISFCSNIQKSVNRPYLHSTRTEKLAAIDEFTRKINEQSKVLKESGSLTFGESQALAEWVKSAQTNRDKVVKILQSHEGAHIATHSTTPKMSDFKFETGLKLPSLTDEGDEISLRDFLDIVQSYHDTLNAAGQRALIKFVTLNRLQGKAKTRLGDLEEVDSFSTLKASLLSRCGTRETLESLYHSLQTSRQGRKSFTSFAEDLEMIASKIANLEIKKQNLTDGVSKKNRSKYGFFASPHCF